MIREPSNTNPFFSKTLLLLLFPEVAKEWHPTKNKELTPEQFTFGSDKKVWWLCPKGHSYYSVINTRTRKKGTGCPYCSGNRVVRKILL